MKIAILGARGFLGQNLFPALLAQGHEVTGFFLNPKQEVVGGLENKSIRDLFVSSINEASTFDVIINLAARRSTRNQYFTDKEVHYFTYEIPKQIILRASNPQTIVINASTYIQNFEGKPGHTIDSYGAAKQELSQFLEQASGLGSFKTRDLFFFTLYGVGDRSSHLVPQLINAAKSGDEIALSPGYQLINLLYVSDAVLNILNCISLSLEANYCKNYVWSEEYFSVRDLVARIELTTGRKINASWGGREYVGHEMLQQWPIPMAQLPGFSAPTNLETGIRLIWKASETA